MKITYDYQIFSNQDYGGISRYYYELIKNLSTYENLQIDIVAPLYKNEYLSRVLGLNANLHGLKVPHSIGRFNRSRNIINRLIQPSIISKINPDLIHETDYLPNKRYKSNAPLVVTVYDLIHELFSSYFPPMEKSLWAKKISLNRADHIICISNNTKLDLQKFYEIPDKKISVIHLGTELIDLPLIDSDINHRPFFLYVGSRGAYKNFDRMLQAFASSKLLRNGLSLIIFGGGKLTDTELLLVNKLGIGSCIKHLSGDDDLLSQLYSKAEFFIYPSLYEGFGIPPLEAMKFDCPVICSNTSSLPEVVGSAALLIDPYSIESIKSAMEKVLTDNITRSELITLGRERVASFSWRQCARETLNVYKKLVS
jgi:glycosyltransferase involved in cell wall biosynthesis